MSKLEKAIWAKEVGGMLCSINGQQPIQMYQSEGTALPLVLDVSGANNFGADLIRFASGKGVNLHSHVGAHILLVTKGTGLLTCTGEKYDLFPGMIYLVPANVEHAIEAVTELVLIAVGDDHKPAGSRSRLKLINKERKI